MLICQYYYFSCQREIVKQNSRNIEIIGIFSAVLALLIIDINIIKAAPNFLAAILLISGLTASLLIFASLIHSLFAYDTKTFWIGIIIIGILTSAGIIPDHLRIWLRMLPPLKKRRKLQKQIMWKSKKPQ